MILPERTQSDQLFIKSLQQVAFSDFKKIFYLLLEYNQNSLARLKLTSLLSVFDR